MKGIYWSLFDMDCIGFMSRSGFDGKSLSDKNFTSAVCTVDTALELIYERPVRAAKDSLALVGIATKIDLSTATIYRLDPGVHDVSVACDSLRTGGGQNRKRYRIRKASTGNTYARGLIYNTLSTRKCSWNRFNEALRYILRNFKTIKGYYSTGFREFRYHCYRNKKKALDKMCKRLFTGSREYREKEVPRCNNNGEAKRPTLVASGTARLSELYGSIARSTKRFRATLLNYIESTRHNQAHAAKCVVMIDEYLASQIYSGCHIKKSVLFYVKPIASMTQLIYVLHSSKTLRT
ncbi:hypothetical protein J3Q64DRAFT_1700775 [Phycomyces blakesleeanus]|uniref:Homeodomain-like DNA binding domain-containing transcription factor n=1 Tax=Phycomyces blakesleeanus TaxID=4837 RepID=A0ABR3AU21_PHYBL